MNHCTLMAELITDPQLRFTQDTQTAIAEFRVVFPGLKSEDEPQQMTVVGWGNLAQEIQGTYHVGDRVLMEGRLSINTVDRPEGFREKTVEMTVQRMYSLGALSTLSVGSPAVPAPAPAAYAPPPGAGAPVATVPTAAPAAPAAAPAPEPEVDYDDIPF